MLRDNIGDPRLISGATGRVTLGSMAWHGMAWHGVTETWLVVEHGVGRLDTGEEEIERWERPSFV